MPGHLPVVLLVKITEGDRIGQELIQVLDAPSTDLLRESDRQLHDHPVGLGLHGALV